MPAKYCEDYPECTQIVYDAEETKCRACRHYEQTKFFRQDLGYENEAPRG